MKKMLILSLILVGIFALGASASVYTDYPDVCDLEPGQYLGSDDTTLGDWEGNYGSYAYILSGMDVSRPRYEWPIVDGDSSQYDITGGPGMPNVDYAVYTERCVTADDRALEHPDQTRRRTTCYWGDSTITLTVPAGTYQLALYFLDWDSYSRVVKVDVTDITGTQTRSVSSFHNGVYEIFNVNGGLVTIHLTKTGGANSVISGVFLDPAGTHPMTSDTTTKGDWVGNYGSQWYLLSAMDSIYTWSNNQPENPIYDVKGGPLPVTYTVSNGNYWAWTDYTGAGGCTMGDAYAWAWGGNTTDPRALTGGSSSWASRASTWDDEAKGGLYVDLSIAEEGTYLLSVYATDFDTNVRVQTITLKNKLTGEIIASSPSELIGDTYHTFYISEGEYTLLAKHTAGANAIIAGIFLDKVVCEEPTGDIRTIGFWKHQFGVATGNRKGKAQIDAGTLESYLPLYGIETLNQGYTLLWLKKATMAQRARQQCLASWLNYANNAVGSSTPVDTDYDGYTDSTFGDAMDEAEALIAAGDYEDAKDICDSINNMEEQDDMISGMAITEGSGISEVAFLRLLSALSIIGMIIVSVVAIKKK